MWPGLEVSNQPQIAYNHTYEKLGPIEKIKITSAWIDSGLDLLLVYFPEVDQSGHANGVEGVGPAVTAVDDAIGQLVKDLESKQIEANIIIVSDHGMTDISNDRKIDFSSWGLEDQGLIVENNREFILIYVIAGNTSEYFSKLAAYTSPGWNLYNQTNMPYRFDFKKDARTPDLLALADVGWVFATNSTRIHGGGHGYDQTSQEMQAIFIGTGPYFPQREIPAINSTEIYNLVCELTKTIPSPNNGTSRLLDLINE